MELKIINKKEDPLLSRTKVEIEITFDKATPSKAEIKSRLGKDLGKEEKLIVVKGIYMEYGLKKAKNLSYVYESEEALKRIEVGKKGKTGKKEESKTEAQEKPAKEKPQEKEEPKKEEKKEQKPGQQANKGKPDTKEKKPKQDKK